ncbi:MAG TPA: protein kinase, partial [Candidatus Krumholzibacteria bacterium]|nr:protein kinase [Candidatus Krumholzibacteria bacterium]
MIGRTLGHYEITALIGRGGMGEVYRARDTRLKRDVALKILPADMAGDPVRLERFQREAETVAGLTHAHIVTLYSVEEADGVRFLTMELVEGQTLDAMIPEGGLTLKQVFEIGTAVADALAAAHEKGIVHRDLKPANVMVAKDGRIKVLDFGLAKLAQPPVSETNLTVTSPITTEGAVMGTVPYMSPEQLRGRDVDHRSDIFSLGIMLFEMASGTRPFAGDTNSDISSSILRDIPPPLDEVRPDLPHHLARIVAHCLEKDPRDRYHSAADVRNELRALRHEVESGVNERRFATGEAKATRARRKVLWIGIAALVVLGLAVAAFWTRGGPKKTTSTGDAPSIAVLPFANMSGDPSQDYFSDGISEELLNLLAQLPSLKVAARTSSFSFKGQNVEVPEIGRRLHVSHVLEGSVRKAGDRVRITAQLIHASDGYHVWSQTYDRTFDDIFAIQDEIAADVTHQLQLALLDKPAPTVRKTNPETYALYLQATQVARSFTAESLQQAEGMLHEALAKDPAYAPAWDALCGIYITQLSLGLLPNAEGAARVRDAATRTAQIDPGFASAYGRLAWVEIYGNNDFAA